MTYSVALVRSARDPRIQVRDVSWEGMAEALTRPRRWEGPKLACAGWMPVRLREGAQRRCSTAVAAIWALVADLDDGSLTWEELCAAVGGLGLRAIAHTTWSHRPGALRARVVVPLSRPCPVERWTEVWAAGSRWAASWGAQVDRACKDPARLYFLPAVPDARRADFRAEVWEGSPLTWEELAPYAPPPVQPRRPRPLHLTVGTDLARTRDRLGQIARGALVAAHRRASTAPAGARNTTVYGAARWLGAIIGAGSLPEAEVRATLLHAALAAGLPEAEAQQTIDNGLAAGEGDRWQWST